MQRINKTKSNSLKVYINPAMVEQVRNKEGTDKAILEIKRGIFIERTDVLDKQIIILMYYFS